MFDYFIYTYGPTLVLAILCAIFGTLGNMAKRMYVNHVNDDTKRAIAWTVVQFVEQVWNTLHGQDKLNKALETAEELLKKKGIAFDASEMTVLIEAAVAEFNDAFHQPLTDETFAGDTRRIGYTDCDDREESGLLE